MKSSGETRKSAGTHEPGEAKARFTDEERSAINERSKELQAEKRRGTHGNNGEDELLAKIAEMPESDRAIAERLHAIIKTAAPELCPKTWYGMPAYAREGNVVCFFQSSHKFKARYATLGFTDKANLDDGSRWPVAYALKELTAADEGWVTSLLKKAMRADDAGR